MFQFVGEETKKEKIRHRHSKCIYLELVKYILEVEYGRTFTTKCLNNLPRKWNIQYHPVTWMGEDGWWFENY